MRARALALVALLLASASAGCLKLEAAHVPDRLLSGAGWSKDASQSDDEPQSESGGLAKQQRLVYKDEATSGRGYPASLTILTVRALVTPRGDSLLEEVQARVREGAEAAGIRVDDETATGTRTLASDAESSWFVYNGTVTKESGLFSRNAKTKILGEIWQCRDEHTVVVAVALAQITDARTIGGVPVSSETDPATWREIVADPTGVVDAGARGSSGLVYNVACS